MMKLFRNPEIKRQIILLLLCCALFVAVGFTLNRACGFFTLGVCMVFFLLYLFWTAWRYEKMAMLSAHVDEILHTGGVLSGNTVEGELGILESELSKMTIRLQEQTEALQREKQFLTDSIADISHQLKTPLTSMSLILSFLKKEDLSLPRRIELVGELSGLLHRMDFLITVLLKMAKIDAGTAAFGHASVPVHTLIDQAAKPLLIPIELREQTLTVNGEEGVAFWGDLVWSTEAIGNILKNCMEHTPRGGEIRVSYEENPLYTQISIEDSGPGFEEGEIPHLFERFFKGKHASESSVGIGLALSRMIFNAQNGTVKASNRPEGGAEFLVRFYKGVV